MSNLSETAQDILDVMWFDHFETAADKRSLAADILRVAIDRIVPPDPCGDDCCITVCEGIREDFLSIIKELDTL